MTHDAALDKHVGDGDGALWRWDGGGGGMGERRPGFPPEAARPPGALCPRR